MEAVVFFAVLAVVILWAAFWVIRLAVRYGTNDALQINRSWLAQTEHDHPTAALPD